MTIKPADVYKWANLMHWCKWIQQGKLELPDDYEHTEAGFMSKGAHKIAYNHRGRSWEECESSLDGLWIVLDGCYRAKQCYCSVRIE